MEKINEQTELDTHTAGAEENEGGLNSEVSLGKFKDVNALLSAYNSLQSEFTKRCQKLKELEGKLSAVENVSPTTTEDLGAQDKKDTIQKEEILKEYLLDVLGKKPKAIVMDGVGVGVKTPVSKPKTIEDAGKLAQEILKNNY